MSNVTKGPRFNNEESRSLLDCLIIWINKEVTEMYFEARELCDKEDAGDEKLRISMRTAVFYELYEYHIRPRERTISPSLNAMVFEIEDKLMYIAQLLA